MFWSFLVLFIVILICAKNTVDHNTQCKIQSCNLMSIAHLCITCCKVRQFWYLLHICFSILDFYDFFPNLCVICHNFWCVCANFQHFPVSKIFCKTNDNILIFRCNMKDFFFYLFRKDFQNFKRHKPIGTFSILPTSNIHKL